MKKKAIIAIVLFQCCLNAVAQQDSLSLHDLANMSLEQLLQVKVKSVSRYPQELDQVPNSALVIRHQQIVDRGYFNLSDLLEDIQGVDISGNAGRFGEFYSLRGIAGNDRILILVNGHKLNPASGTFISVGKSISIRHAQRVELVYGPASAVYGADAFAGIVNIVFDNNLGEQNANVSAYSHYGTMNTFDIGFNAATKFSDDFSAYVSARQIRSDGFDVVGSDEKYDIVKQYKAPLKNHTEQTVNDHNVFLKLQYKKISLNYYRQQFDQGNAIGTNPKHYVFNEENRWKTSTDILWINYNENVFDNASLTVDFSYKYHLQNNNSLFYKWTEPNVFEDTYKQYMTGKDNTFHGLVTFNQKLSDKFQYIVGFDNENTSSIPPYANDEVLGRSEKYEGENAALIDEKLTIYENRTSIFAQCTYSPFEQLDLIVGTRFDYSTRYGSVVNPRFGLIFSRGQSSKVRFNFGKAFQAPSLLYQYEQFGTASVVMLSSSEVRKLQPGWELENQIVYSYELSYEQKFGENYNLKTTSYYNRLSNLIERKLFAVAPESAVFNKYFNRYTSGLRNENIGKQRIFGLDVVFNAKIARRVLLYAAYSFTDALAEQDIETKIPRISAHKCWFGITAKNIFGFLTVSPRFKWVGDMHNANSVEFPTNKQPGFHTLDLSVSTNKLGKYVTLYANFDNILDQKNEHGGLYGQTGSYTATIPQAGFSFCIGIEAKFSK